MSNATRWNDWEKLILQLIEQSIYELSEMVLDKLQDSIIDNVYVGQNKVYKSTYEFLESWKIIKDNKNKNLGVVVYSDPDEMIWRKDLYQHGSLNDISESLPEILAENLSGSLFGRIPTNPDDGAWWNDRKNYWEEFLRDLQRNGWLNKTFKKILRSKGLKVV